MRVKKQSRPRLLAKQKSKRSKAVDKKIPKPLPDTSRIPWFPALPKTGTDA